MKVIETPRLILRRLTVDDAPFVLRLLNEPSFLRFIGDRGVHSLAKAREYLLIGAIASYERLGFGMYLVESKPAGIPLGLCGLVRRTALPDADLGFAFLPEFWSKGYAVESAAAVMEHARALGLKRVAAITSVDNESSIALLGKLGFEFERLITLPGETEEINLFAIALEPVGLR